MKKLTALRLLNLFFIFATLVYISEREALGKEGVLKAPPSEANTYDELCEKAALRAKNDPVVFSQRAASLDLLTCRIYEKKGRQTKLTWDLRETSSDPDMIGISILRTCTGPGGNFEIRQLMVKWQESGMKSCEIQIRENRYIASENGTTTFIIVKRNNAHRVVSETMETWRKDRRIKILEFEEDESVSQLENVTRNLDFYKSVHQWLKRKEPDPAEYIFESHRNKELPR